MNQEEIQKLLGGYATNSLTDSERKALFEAALDDQELFDALHREQALKDVLGDPISRRQVRDALEAPVAQARAWWTRGWTWGLAAGALAAVLAVAVIVVPDRTGVKREFDVAMAVKPTPTDARSPLPDAQLKAPEPKADVDLYARRVAPQPRLAKDSEAPRVRQTSEKEVAGTPVPPPPAALSEARIPAEVAQQQTQAAPEPQSQAAQQNALQSQAALRSQAMDQSQAAASNTKNGFRDEPSGVRPAAAPRPTFAAGYAGLGGAIKTPALTYLLLKRQQDGTYSQVAPSAPLQQGDAVRLNVLPSAAGYLNLYELDSSGGMKRLFPAAGAGIKVSPNTTYTMPDSPIDVKNEEQLRLVLSPDPAVAVPASKLKAVEIKPQRADRTTPVVVDITLGSKKE